MSLKLDSEPVDRAFQIGVHFEISIFQLQCTHTEHIP